jgi:hypothetical protein
MRRRTPARITRLRNSRPTASPRDVVADREGSIASMLREVGSAVVPWGVQSTNSEGEGGGKRGTP